VTKSVNFAIFGAAIVAFSVGAVVGGVISPATFQSLIPAAWLRPSNRASDSRAIPNDQVGEEIRYGRALIEKTEYYLGPKGTVGQYLGNSMNCQNCHLDAGTRPFGGSFVRSHSAYPQWRSREGVIITLADRINLCIQRPHQGRYLPESSREMRAILVYIKWLGEIPPDSGTPDEGYSIGDLPPISRAADPTAGWLVYKAQCQVCHGENGAGQRTEDGISYLYPPLWGPDSYGIGSSMYRVRKAAAFIKYNMPYGTVWTNPKLTDEEAFDVAAFINDDRIHPRKIFDISKDYPNIADKPADSPFGPFMDSFSEMQHKFGPFKPILKAKKDGQVKHQ